MSKELFKRIAKNKDPLIKPVKIKTKEYYTIGTDMPFHIKKGAWYKIENGVVSRLQTETQSQYNRKLLRLYRAMAAKKSNGSDLWDFIRLHPVEMLEKAKIKLKERLK